MEQFTKLSISDDQDQTQSQDGDAVAGILHLSISDPSEDRCRGFDVERRYMPYFPTSPSPLRHSLRLFDNRNGSENDNENVDVDVDVDMDMDMEIDPDGENSVSSSTSDSAVGSEAYSIVSRSTPSISSIRKWEKAREKEIAKDLQDIVISDEVSNIDVGNGERGSNPKGSGKTTTTTSMLRALLSPTKLGVAAATTDILPDTSGNNGDTSAINERRDAAVQASIAAPVPILAKTSATSPQVIPQVSSDSDSSLELLKSELRARSRDQPIQVSVNNHNNYYYYNGYPHTSFHSAVSSPSAPSNPPTQTQWDFNDQYTLPHPWSPTSKPASRRIYNYVSYLQLALNTLTVTLVASYLGGIIKADLNSLWYTDKQLLINESNYCKRQYTLNRCNENYRLPALSKDCESWRRCMQRDDELAFGNRSVLMMGLFGRLINSFVEPIGYKAAIFLAVGVVVWCFSSNFLLGFLRAKYYYYAGAARGSVGGTAGKAGLIQGAGDKKPQLQVVGPMQ